MVGHVAPEAFRGGPIAALQEGDTIAIDVEAGELRVELSDDEIAARLAHWTAAAAALRRRRARQVRGARLLGERGRGDPTLRHRERNRHRRLHERAMPGSIGVPVAAAPSSRRPAAAARPLALDHVRDPADVQARRLRDRLRLALRVRDRDPDRLPVERVLVGGTRFGP